ncbi:hypothetical protein FM038_25290 [Shewanella eurypsychrophilus]|uniref:FtsK gamma domain-containing protein n=1 Tax=Shewanella eurypsychrophilus TaxID=2593656 RepID=A0ABX8S5G4_9GAMM|nr:MULTISPECIES: hypothetical protein [Shewanella]QXP44971.1 hypothetical protein FM038_25290 [Shewanella eurypsychrophilus]
MKINQQLIIELKNREQFSLSAIQRHEKVGYLKAVIIANFLVETGLAVKVNATSYSII